MARLTSLEIRLARMRDLFETDEFLKGTKRPLPQLFKGAENCSEAMISEAERWFDSIEVLMFEYIRIVNEHEPRVWKMFVMTGYDGREIKLRKEAAARLRRELFSVSRPNLFNRETVRHENKSKKDKQINH